MKKIDDVDNNYGDNDKGKKIFKIILH